MTTAPVQHRSTTVDTPSVRGPGAIARCSCGWLGSAWRTVEMAERQVDDHVLAAIEYDDAIR